MECHRHGSRPHANDARARFRAGLQESQRFLERGVDTFTDMARQLGVETFLETVKLRETRWLEVLFGVDLALASSSWITP